MAEPASVDRRVPRLIAGLGVVLLGLLIWRTLSWDTRPTESVPLSKINLNTADRAELLQVPGIGSNTADAILAHRAKKGRFESVDELDHLPGIGQKTLQKLRPWFAIGPGGAKPLVDDAVEKLERKPAPAKPATIGINVNTATAEELDSLPGIGPKLAQSIIAERTKSPFKTIEDLRRVSGIGPKTIDKLRPLVRFE